MGDRLTHVYLIYRYFADTCDVDPVAYRSLVAAQAACDPSIWVSLGPDAWETQLADTDYAVIRRVPVLPQEGGA